MSKKTPTQYERHLAKQAARSQAFRDRAKASGRPSPAQVDRAIVEASQRVWEGWIRRVTKNDPNPDAMRAASAQPISLYRVADKAVAILVERKRANKELAAKMVMARLAPRPAFTIKVSKATNPLTLETSGTRTA